MHTPDPAADLLAQREVRALWISTFARCGLISIMAPTAWLLGTAMWDRIATLLLLTLYALVVVGSAYWLRRRRRIRSVGLAGVILDVLIVGALPFIWYTTMGGSEISTSVLLKSSVTVFSLLLIALNTLAMRPLYPALMTLGALLIHAVLFVLAWTDETSAFTTSYLLDYTSAEVSIGRIVTNVLVVAIAGILLTLHTVRARAMIVEAARLQSTNVQLGRYFSPNLVRRLSEQPELLQIGGERRELSFVFTDLAGFTSFVEAHAPETVVPVLNGYLDALVQVVFKYEGTVDKIVGDAVHVIFGAPITQSDHAKRAVACALELDRVAESFRQAQGAELRLGLTRIGVNSGLAVVGNFGSAELFDYTAHGDAINVAARLEAANKRFGTRICVSAATVSCVDEFYGRPIGVLTPQGLSQGIEVYEALSPDMVDKAHREVYLRAYSSLVEGDEKAERQFDELCQSYPSDGLAAYHLARLKAGANGVLLRSSP